MTDPIASVLITFAKIQSTSQITFQRLIGKNLREVLVRLKWQMCLVYLDDVIVFGRRFADHQQRF